MTLKILSNDEMPSHGDTVMILIVHIRFSTSDVHTVLQMMKSWIYYGYLVDCNYPLQEVGSFSQLKVVTSSYVGHDEWLSSGEFSVVVKITNSTRLVTLNFFNSDDTWSLTV